MPLLIYFYLVCSSRRRNYLNDLDAEYLASCLSFAWILTSWAYGLPFPAAGPAEGGGAQPSQLQLLDGPRAWGPRVCGGSAWQDGLEGGVLLLLPLTCAVILELLCSPFPSDAVCV